MKAKHNNYTIKILKWRQNAIITQLKYLNEDKTQAIIKLD